MFGGLCLCKHRGPHSRAVEVSVAANSVRSPPPCGEGVGVAQQEKREATSSFPVSTVQSKSRAHRASSKIAPPPPLTPSHKGEGNRPSALRLRRHAGRWASFRLLRAEI